MAIYQETIKLSTKGNSDILDITQKVAEIIRKSKIDKGLASVFVSGSTAGLATIEHESGLLEDLKAAFGRWAGQEARYCHNRRGEDNGHAHIRSSLVGTSLSVGVIDGRAFLGTWQQIVLIDFDTRPRERTLLVEVMGE